MSNEPPSYPPAGPPPGSPPPGGQQPPGGYPQGGYPQGGYPPPPGQQPPGGYPAGGYPAGGYPQGQYPQGQYPPGQPAYGTPYGAPAGFGAPPVRPSKKWYQRWWVWLVGVIAVGIIAAVVFVFAAPPQSVRAGVEDQIDAPGGRAHGVQRVVPQLDQHRPGAQLRLHRSGRRQPHDASRHVRDQQALRRHRVVRAHRRGAARKSGLAPREDAPRDRTDSIPCGERLPSRH